MVSGTLSLPSRGTFHHSLTVLSAIGHQEVFRLSEWSRQIHNALHGNAATRGHRPRPCLQCSPTGLITHSGHRLHGVRLTTAQPWQTNRSTQRAPTTPHTQPLSGLTRAWFSLFRVRSPLLAESPVFSLPTGTEMFHFPAFPPHTLYIQVRVTRHHSGWVSPFGHPRITAR